MPSLQGLFPIDHVGSDPRVTGEEIRDLGLAVNGLAMRYSNPAFKIGAFTSLDPAVRREAIDLTKRGIDTTQFLDSPNSKSIELAMLPLAGCSRLAFR